MCCSVDQLMLDNNNTTRCTLVKAKRGNREDSDLYITPQHNDTQVIIIKFPTSICNAITLFRHNLYKKNCHIVQM